MPKEHILISACLLGIECKYSGGSNKISDSRISLLTDKYELIPVCPEAYGGLTTPRLPSERVGDRVLAKDKTDVTEQYLKGAETALYMAEMFNCRRAVLKQNSPSCGHDRIYDGTFTGTLVPGDGVTAELLMKNGINIFGEDDIEKLL